MDGRTGRSRPAPAPSSRGRALRRALGTVVKGAGALIVLVLAAAIWNAAVAPNRHHVRRPRDLTEVERAAHHRLRAELASNRDEIVARFVAGIRIPTISHPDASMRNASAFHELHRLLQKQFPAAHRALTREVVNDFSLLYAWKGRDASLRPVMFAAHLDVVPVEEATVHLWTHPAFAGVVDQGFIWGRGTLDDKVGAPAYLGDGP